MSNLRFTTLSIIILTIAFVLVACSSSLSEPTTAAPTEVPIAVPTAVKQTPYTVMLVCDDCAAVGMKINVWQNAGTSRGSVSFSVPHNTTVNVTDSKSADDGRRWYKVEYRGNIGWIPEDFVRR